jgi:hypothetical protein
MIRSRVRADRQAASRLLRSEKSLVPSGDGGRVRLSCWRSWLAQQMGGILPVLQRPR